LRRLTLRARIPLARHSWPGNVRELQNVIGHACMLAPGQVIDVADLPQYMRQDRGAEAPLVAAQPAGAGEALSFDAQERRVLEQALSIARAELRGTSGDTRSRSTACGSARWV
jgi:DNA-binding NtrC family response regulator